MTITRKTKTQNFPIEERFQFQEIIAEKSLKDFIGFLDNNNKKHYSYNRRASEQTNEHCHKPNKFGANESNNKSMKQLNGITEFRKFENFLTEKSYPTQGCNHN